MDWQALRKQAFDETKKALSESVGDDQLVVQGVSAIEDCDKAANLLARRLREWYEWYFPELSRKVTDNEAFARLVAEKSRKELMAELDINKTMGAPFKEEDITDMVTLAGSVGALFKERDLLEGSIKRIMGRHCPNLLALAGPTIGARLLREAGSLRRLATIQASTIQVYGAEKALFRHLRSGAKPPKHGYIIHHPLLTQAPQKDKGKVARALADKLSIASRVDYFKGEPIGEKLKKELEARFL